MTDRAKYWGRMLAAWEASGLTQAEFCRRRGLKAVTFAWWKRQLAGRTARRGRRTPGSRTSGGRAERNPSFVEVALPRATVTGGSTSSTSSLVGEPGYEVALPNGASIRLPVSFDVDKASQLISTVARSC